MNADIKVDMSAFVKALEGIGDRIAQRQAAEQDLLAAAEPLVQQMQAAAPRDPGGRPGFAAETIHAEAQETRSADEIARIAIGPTGFHLRFSEFGTSKEPARPWMRPVIDGGVGVLSATLGERIQARIQAGAR